MPPMFILCLAVRVFSSRLNSFFFSSSFLFQSKCCSLFLFAFNHYFEVQKFATNYAHCRSKEKKNPDAMLIQRWVIDIQRWIEREKAKGTNFIFKQNNEQHCKAKNLFDILTSNIIVHSVRRICNCLLYVYHCFHLLFLILLFIFFNAFFVCFRFCRFCFAVNN